MNKCTNKKLYDFLVDKTNKNLIVTFLAFIALLLFNIFINNIFLRIVFYLGFYLLINNIYFKLLDLFFVDFLKNNL